MAERLAGSGDPTSLPGARPRRRWLRRAGTCLAVVLLLAIVSGAWQRYKPLPDGIGAQMPLRTATDIAFLADLTWSDAGGAGAGSDHEIADEMLGLIAQAQRLVVVDMFLFNAFAGEPDAGYRPLSDELTQALIARRRALPELRVVLITDPLNRLYGGLSQPHLQRLAEAGVVVIETDLRPLRASNPAWTGLWSLCCGWAGNTERFGWLPNPLGEGRVTLRSYLALLNFRANHRKVVVVDQGDDWVGLVGSGNPHDASSRHGNVALRFSGAAAVDLLDTELAVAAMSGQPGAFERPLPPVLPASGEGPWLQVLIEGRIRDALLAAVESAGPGDRIDIDVFYFSHRGLVRALLDAHRRGVALRVLMDPNRDAFGREKDGIPNRQVGAELHAAGIPVRWCDTRGEQCHAKLLLRRGVDGGGELILGSANFTRRNLDDLNLETSMRVVALGEVAAIEDAATYFDARWENRDGRGFSLDYDAYADASRLRRWRYRIAEATGLSTF